MNFDAVVLAGGQSSRMGRDKAWLEVQGQSLLARQIQLARAVGAAEVFISGRADQDYAPLGCPVLTDNFPKAGPLAGIESALQIGRNPLLLVIPVDMPLLTAAALEQLKQQSGGRDGIIPRHGGRVEPLAAIYPRAAAKLAAQLLLAAVTEPEATPPGAGLLAARCVSEGLARYYDLPDALAKCFTSWNEPRDIASS